MTTQEDVLLTLSYLLGERTTPTGSQRTTRADFIQVSLEEIYRAYPWSFASANATLSFVDGNATLPTNFDYQHKVYGYFNDGSYDTETKEINIGDSDMFQDGDYKFWIEHISDGRYKIVTKDTNYSTAVVKYQTTAPVLDASTGTPINDKGLIALGARRYVKMSENPEADISQDEALFQKRLTEKIAMTQLSRPTKKHRKVYYANNYRLGDE